MLSGVVFGDAADFCNEYYRVVSRVVFQLHVTDPFPHRTLGNCSYTATPISRCN